jgi:SagB-type dehydrogenase family enzyme
MATILNPAESVKSGEIPDLEVITRLLHYTGGITKRLRFSRRGRQIPFRAAACTGALYHIELYLLCAGLPDLDAGLYHYDPEANQLAMLRPGDHRGALAAARADAGAIGAAPATIIFTDGYWRNAFKYQAREYRHAFWDSGTMLANAMAMSTALDLGAEVILGFVDDQVQDLLALGGQPEFPLLLLPVGRADAPPPEPPARQEVPRAEQGAEGYSTTYPAITDMVAASALGDEDEAARWRRRELSLPVPEPEGEWIPMPSDSGGEAGKDQIEAVIQRRGSSRRFQRIGIPFDVLAQCLQAASAPLPADVLKGGLDLNHVYLVVNAVDGVEPGAYVYHPARGGLERLARGDFRRRAGGMALGQALAADASAALFYLTDLEPVLEEFGNRGYRAAQLEASTSAGRVYLAAYAQRIGASGLTFYDDAVVEFFSPHAAGKSAMFLITIGNPG